MHYLFIIFYSFQSVKKRIRKKIDYQRYSFFRNLKPSCKSKKSNHAGSFFLPVGRFVDLSDEICFPIKMYEFSEMSSIQRDNFYLWFVPSLK